MNSRHYHANLDRHRHPPWKCCPAARRSVLPSPSMAAMAESSPPNSCSSTWTLPGWWWWRLWRKELSDVPLVLPATLQNLERTIEDEECAQALASYHEAEQFEPIHCHVCLGQPVCIDEGSLKKFNCGGVLQRPGEWRGVDHPATKVCQNKTLYPVKIKIADRVKKGKSANLKMKKISWAQCIVPRGEGLHKGS